MNIKNKKWNKALVVVAHPDDETIWSGGFILSQPKCQWEIITLCRGDDPDRAPKFQKALKTYKAQGQMASLDDGPEQNPLDSKQIQTTILEKIAKNKYDLIVTHSLKGEYNSHLRHEEVAQAVLDLWQKGKIIAESLLMYAYLENKKIKIPQAIKSADLILELSGKIYAQKLAILKEIYNFPENSFEIKAAQAREAFWTLTSVKPIKKQLKERSLFV